MRPSDLVGAVRPRLQWVRRITLAVKRSTNARPSMPPSQASATSAAYEPEPLIEVAEDAAQGVERVFGPAGRRGLQEGPAAPAGRPGAES